MLGKPDYWSPKQIEEHHPPVAILHKAYDRDGAGNFVSETEEARGLIEQYEYAHAAVSLVKLHPNYSPDENLYALVDHFMEHLDHEHKEESVKLLLKLIQISHHRDIKLEDAVQRNIHISMGHR